MRTALVLIYVFLHAGVRVSAQPAQLSLQGRFAGNVSEATGLGVVPVLFSWPASSVYASFKGSGINATLSALPPSPTYDAYSRFVFYVDGAQVGTAATSPNATLTQWNVSGLVSGQHNLTITKISEASYGQVYLEALDVAPGGSFVSPALPPAFLTGRRIMFIGDSYTVGHANTGGTTMCNKIACNPITKVCVPELDSQNDAISWGPLTAANFTADFQVIAWSGAGLATYSNAEALVAQEPMVPISIAEGIYPQDIELFGRQVAGDNSSMTPDNGSWTPQVVVLAGGTNDFHAAPPDLDQWLSDIINFMNTINEEYHNPQIIIQVYPLEQQLEGVLNQTQATTYLQYMSSLYTEAQAEGMTNVHYLQLNAVNMPLSDWCSSHPSAAADANIAAQLSNFIEAVLPEWTTSTHPLSVTI